MFLRCFRVLTISNLDVSLFWLFWNYSYMWVPWISHVFRWPGTSFCNTPICSTTDQYISQSPGSLSSNVTDIPRHCRMPSRPIILTYTLICKLYQNYIYKIFCPSVICLAVSEMYCFLLLIQYHCYLKLVQKCSSQQYI